MAQLIHFFKQPRQLLQLSVLMITLGIGLHFFLYVHEAMEHETITIQRPPGVEGFLPIGAIMGWKQFLITGRWDGIHPAAMVIFGWAVLISLVFRKAFCGWFCPIGTVSEWFWRIGKFTLGRNIKLPGWIDIPLRSLKYLLLGFFLWAVSTMDTDQISSFMNSPYYKLSDVKMLFFFTRISILTAVVLLTLSVLSLLIKNFWCRYLCPYGALLGLVALISPTRIRRSAHSCIQCKACDRACPSHLSVSKKATINNPECNGCISCIEACPKKDALTLKSLGFSHKFWSPLRAGVFITLFFVISFYLASISGNWHSSVTEHEFRTRIKTIDSPENTHPSFKF